MGFPQKWTQCIRQFKSEAHFIKDKKERQKEMIQ